MRPPKRRRRHRPWKPWSSGTWWSSSEEYRRWTTGRVPEGFDLGEDSVGPEVQFAAAVAAPVDVLEIRRALNWARLCHEHPLQVWSSERVDLSACTARRRVGHPGRER